MLRHLMFTPITTYVRIKLITADSSGCIKMPGETSRVTDIKQRNKFVKASPKISVFFSLRIKPTDAMNSNFIGIRTLHVSGSLSAHHQFLAVHRLVHFM